MRKTLMYVRVIRPHCDGYTSRHAEGLHGFDPNNEYQVHKIESYSDTGCGYVVLVNDQREIWWVDNRHVRVTRESETEFGSLPKAHRNGAGIL